MLYKIRKEGSEFNEIEPMGFKDFASFGKSEKDLENLISNNLLTTLFEDGSLMPIFQERQWQAEADIYALNSNGDLIIFELKRSSAGEGALHQALRYSQTAGRWTFSELEKKYRTYEKTDKTLKLAHKEAFDLEEPLLEREFNQKQHLLVIGSAADDSLIEAVNYWKNNGVKIDFLPYRLYKIGKEVYFEFFSKPYDRHINPLNTKGVLFDTNRTYDTNAIWDMYENDYVAAYGDVKHVIYHIKKGDIVFLSHTGHGIVGACKVKGNVDKNDEYTWFRKVEFLTKKTEKGNPLKAMPFWKVREVLSKNFYWAKTIKVPYLSNKEADLLLDELKKYLK